MSVQIPCTVQVLTRNSAEGLEACLQSLANFAEVIVQDGYSTDETHTIAEQFQNVRIMDQNKEYLNDEGRIANFAAMRNESIKAAAYDWVFVIDGDEYVESKIMEEVRAIVEANKPGIYQAFRRFIINGTRIMRSSFYPAYQIRLFHRSLTDGYGKPIHERLIVHDGVELQLLTHELPVPLPPAKELQLKFDRYLAMERNRHGVMPWGRWLRWILLWQIRSILGLTIRRILLLLQPWRGPMLPYAYEWQYIKQAWRMIINLNPLAATRYAKLKSASHTSAT